jgi:hypothetical protein
MKRFPIVILLLASSLFITGKSAAQNVAGVVITVEGVPVSDALVFVANTSISTSTNDEGAFALTVPDLGSFNVVAVTSNESLGVVTVFPDSEPNLSITLSPKPEMAAASTSALTREELLDFFESTTFSRTKNAEDIEIGNTDNLILNHDASTNIISVSSSTPFTFRNNALGYEITIYDFQMGGNQVAFGWSGYAFFSKLEAPKAKNQKTWDKNREKTYKGSQRHFLKAIADEKLKKEEFAAFFVQGPGSQDDHSPVLEAGLRSVYGAPQPIMFNGKTDSSKRLDFTGWLRIQFYGSGSDNRWERYIERFWPISELSEMMKTQSNISFIQLPEYQAVFNAGGIVWPTQAPSIQTMGYWSFSRLADTLPIDWASEK